MFYHDSLDSTLFLARNEQHRKRVGEAGETALTFGILSRAYD
jgi:hypothetical protein